MKYMSLSFILILPFPMGKCDFLQWPISSKLFMWNLKVSQKSSLKKTRTMKTHWKQKRITIISFHSFGLLARTKFQTSHSIPQEIINKFWIWQGQRRTCTSQRQHQIIASYPFQHVAQMNKITLIQISLITCCHYFPCRKRRRKCKRLWKTRSINHEHDPQCLRS